MQAMPSALAIIAGKGAYPWLLAESARKQGVTRLVAIAFRKETESVIERHVDEVKWIYLGQYGHMLDALKESGVRYAVMAGQITPTNLFRIRLDGKMLELLSRLKVRNAETIFGAVGDDLKAIGIELLPASSFMESHMPSARVLTKRPPTENEQRDIELGMKVAGVTSGLDIGQTVVVKDGTIMAVEAFEGTNEAIMRAAELGGEGIVVVKVAKRGHDMRFDIPVVGMHTMKVLKKAGAKALAVEAGRCIVLEREKVVAEADRLGLCMVAVQQGEAGRGR